MFRPRRVRRLLKRRLRISLLLTVFLVNLLLFTAGTMKAQTTPPTNPEPSTVATLTGPPIVFKETSEGITLNFTMFTVFFASGTAGYNKIYHRNGSVLVYDDRIILEYLGSDNKWKQRGTPTGVGYVKYSDYHYVVTRHYDDYLGTTYDIAYMVKSDSPMKISVTPTSGQTDTYRIAWYPSGITYTDWVKKGNRLVFGSESVPHGWVGFDWEDVYQSFGDITQTSCEDVAQGKKANIYFNIGVVEAGQTVVVDPSLVATSESSAATGYNTQRKLARLSDGTLYSVYFKKLNGYYQIYVKKSTDNGATWTDETRISTYSGMDSNHQSYPSIAVDSNNYLHVVWHGMATGYTDYYQVWYAEYTTSWATPVRISTYSGMDSNYQYYPSIAVDSNNYLHVVWHGMATGYTDYYQVWYAEYTTSWATPVRISTYSGMDSNYQSYPSIAVDSNNYLHVVWHGMATGYTDYYQVWYAEYTTSWATPVRISTYSGMDSNYQYYPSIAVDSNNYLHVVWHGKATGYTDYYQVWYAEYTTSWATPVRISTYSGMDSNYQYRPSIAVDSNNYLHVVWHGMATGYTDYNKVWYTKYETSWSTPECLQATGQNQYPNLRWSRYPTSNQVTDRLDYVFTEGTASPYNIKFDYVTSNKAPNAPTLDSPAANARYDLSESVQFTWTFSDPDGGDTQSAYRFQLDDNSDFTSPVTDTGKVSSTTSSTNQNMPGSVGLYYWRVKTWDNHDAEGAWSSGRTIRAERVLVYSLTADDDHVEIGVTVTLTVHLQYESDSTAITSGSFTLNGLTLTHQSAGDWTTTDSRSTVTSVTYDSVSGSVGEVSGVNMNGKSVTVYWEISAPTGCSASYVSDTQIDISWTDTSSVEEGFRIERRVDDGSWTFLINADANAQSHSDTSTSANHKYEYRVRAYKGADSSDWSTSSPAYTTPAAPSGCTNVKDSVSSILVSWTDNSGYEEGFRVERSVNEGSWTFLINKPAGSTSHLDTGLSVDTKYQYRVRAYRSSPDELNSDWSTASSYIYTDRTPSVDYLALEDPYVGSQGVICTLYHTYRVKATDLDGGDTVAFVKIYFDPSGQNIQFKWTRSTDSFSEVSDPNGYAEISSTSADSSLTGNQWTLDFKVKFAVEYPDVNLHSVKVRVEDNDGISDDDTYSNIYYVAHLRLIGFEAPSSVTSDQWFLLNATAQVTDGVSYFDYVQVELSHGVILKWKYAGDIFNVQADPDWYMILDVAGCSSTQLNSTSFKLTWRIQLMFTYPAGSVDVLAANTKVVQTGPWAGSGSGNATGLFTLQKGTTYTAEYGPYTVESSGSLGEGGEWAGWNGTLISYTAGNIHITGNPYGEPEWVKVNGETWPSNKWHYFPSTENIVIREVASKVEVHWRSYVYTLHGPYDEETGLYYGSGVNVTVYSFYGESQTFNLNSSSSPYQLNLTYHPLCVAMHFPLERRIYVVEQQADIYVWGNHTTSYIYSLTVKDLAGFIDDATYLEACRWINGSLRIIERRPLDVVNPVNLALQYMAPYRIIVKSLNKDQTHVFDVTADDEVEKVLVVTGVDFTEKVKTAYKYIRIEAFRESSTTIKINYEDLMEQTISVYFEIEFMNGTSTGWNGTLTSNSGTLTMPGADPDTDYRVKATVDHHVLHGSYLHCTTYVPKTPGSSYPFNLAALGTFPIPSHNVFPMLLVVFVACCFSALTAGVGIVLTVIMTAILCEIGWLEIPAAAITLAISLAILVSIALAKRRGH